jgi:hypothetical protein
MAVPNWSAVPLGTGMANHQLSLVQSRRFVIAIFCQEYVMTGTNRMMVQ